jgi:hypothetical protein
MSSTCYTNRCIEYCACCVLRSIHCKHAAAARRIAVSYAVHFDPKSLVLSVSDWYLLLLRVLVLLLILLLK